MTRQSLANLADPEILARVVWGEARGESAEGRAAVAWVVKNRAAARTWYGRGISGVCLKPKQFSCLNSDDPNLAAILRLRDDDPVLNQCREIAEAVLSSAPSSDPTHGATHYHTANIAPGWAATMVRTARIGNHIFYRIA